ncbi:hypothetical protein D3C71_1597130 [compost metagenome]
MHDQAVHQHKKKVAPAQQPWPQIETELADEDVEHVPVPTQALAKEDAPCVGGVGMAYGMGIERDAQVGMPAEVLLDACRHVQVFG